MPSDDLEIVRDLDLILNVPTLRFQSGAAITRQRVEDYRRKRRWVGNVQRNPTRTCRREKRNEPGVALILPSEFRARQQGVAQQGACIEFVRHVRLAKETLTISTIVITACIVITANSTYAEIARRWINRRT